MQTCHRGTVACVRPTSGNTVRVLLVVAALVALVGVAAAPADASQFLAQAQTEVDDGTRPLRILAVAMGVLAILLAVLTWFYWKATTPPARRGYLPMPEWGASSAGGAATGDEVGLAHVDDTRDSRGARAPAAEPQSRDSSNTALQAPQPTLRDSLKSRPVLGDTGTNTG